MSLDEVREEIRTKDLEIISLIAERIACAERIAEIKTEQGLPVKDPEIERKVIERYVSEGMKRGIGKRTMELIARSLIDECVEAENRVVEGLRK